MAEAVVENLSRRFVPDRFPRRTRVVHACSRPRAAERRMSASARCSAVRAGRRRRTFPHFSHVMESTPLVTTGARATVPQPGQGSTSGGAVGSRGAVAIANECTPGSYPMSRSEASPSLPSCRSGEQRLLKTRNDGGRAGAICHEPVAPAQPPGAAVRRIVDPVSAPTSADPTVQWLLEHGGSDVDTMTGAQFERCLAVMFTRLGYHVELTETYDFGADLIVTRDASRSAVQAKRQKTWVGDHAVQQAVTGRLYYQCHTASVVTTAEVQARARNVAAKAGVLIVDRGELTRLLQMAEMVQSPQLLSAPLCRRCVIQLTERRSRHGPFWGCANYPQGCRSTARYRYSLIIAQPAAAEPTLTVLQPPPPPQAPTWSWLPRRRARDAAS